jgi:hypothetical protein
MLKLLEAEVIPVTGGISRHPKLRIAKFTQHHLEMFDMENDAVTHMRNLQAQVCHRGPHLCNTLCMVPDA